MSDQEGLPTLDGDQLIAAEIPDRLYFKIGEVAKITDLKEYVLRYWETEFNLIKPVKSSKGQRVYRKKDIESILFIKKLLYKERYSIEGARRKIKELRKGGELAQAKKPKITIDQDHAKQLKAVYEELRDLVEDCHSIDPSFSVTDRQLPF